MFFSKSVIIVRRVEVFAAVIIKVDFFWDIAACSPIFDCEDGGDTFFRIVGSYTDYTALCP
jgi:hypothetical protein